MNSNLWAEDGVCKFTLTYKCIINSGQKPWDKLQCSFRFFLKKISKAIFSLHLKGHVHYSIIFFTILRFLFAHPILGSYKHCLCLHNMLNPKFRLTKHNTWVHITSACKFWIVTCWMLIHVAVTVTEFPTPWNHVALICDSLKKEFPKRSKNILNIWMNIYIPI